MAEKYKNKYRIASTRLQNWNYGWSAAYFVTICTRNRVHYFGEINDEQMCLSEIGKVAESEWLKTIKIRPDMNLEMGEFVVMPNHFHAIITIGENQYNTQQNGQQNGQRTDAMHCVSTTNTTNTNGENKFGVQSKNLASIIRGFKSAVTTFARKNGHTNFNWQTRFHEHIIRNQKSFDRISNYIINNPKKWNDDKFCNQ